MLPSLFPVQSKPKNSFRSIDELTDVFKSAYNQLNSPLLLCDGLEIIISNKAAQQLLCRDNSILPELLTGLVPCTQAISNLFHNSPHPISASIGDKQFLVTAAPWKKQPRLFLIEWIDKSEQLRIAEQLHHAQHYDPVTGALLTEAFCHKISALLPTIKSGMLLQISINKPAPRISTQPHYNTQYQLIELVKQLDKEFNQDMIIARDDTSKLSLFIETDCNQRECQHLLKQIDRLIKTFTSVPYRIVGAIFPQDGKSLKTL